MTVVLLPVPHPSVTFPSGIPAIHSFPVRCYAGVVRSRSNLRDSGGACDPWKTGYL